ncbi:WAT1-related protein At4g30420-like [Dioscorea cayenensis subsp. rotundata]|uniref:WAT1-related protein n=1 Tax=Dioscorea cayennensis subsp. rotundata TaxID=55577 RepID=A0AB40BRW8_DIOCR|nr:WAT1-related protein At4g30420-like [Dioscorea cayenensis subsp. rotundata]XP_039130218.1 WAT1-related protein At4g30420-like [Dioscorea cayenensis subsp. rotundata]
MKEGRVDHGLKEMVAMVVVQSIYACMTIFSKEAFTEGMSIIVFVVYRQAIASLLLIPTSILNRGKIDHLALGLKGFLLVFLISFVGPFMTQYLYYNGLDLLSSSLATAMANTLPAATFLMALVFGVEKLKPKSLRTYAKIFGTLICVAGAVCMALYKGSKLHNINLLEEKWIKGFLFLSGSICCWSLWLILQAIICKNYLDPLSLATWVSFLSTMPSFILALIIETNSNAWIIKSVSQLLSCLFVGIFGSGVTFYLVSWVIASRGPVFSALFAPLSLVITTILGALLLQENVYVGSLVGATSVVGGLYMVLWGKTEDYETKAKVDQKDDSTEQDDVQSSLHESLLIGRDHDIEGHLQIN